MTPEKKELKATRPQKKQPTENKPKKVKKESGWMWRIFMALLSLGALGLTGAVCLIVGALFYFSKDLPDYSALADYEPPIVTMAYANDGRLLAEFAAEKRVFVPIEAVPPLVINAFLSAEDKNFYSHPGVDFMGIVRAMATNVKNAGSGRRLVGASTITQQVAKNFLLTNEVSYVRKIKEAILSFRIEDTLSKERILELYLNEIYLGARAYGVQAASLEYFNKPLDELKLEEAAFLAALPKAPNNYRPDRYYDEAVGRRNWVIDQMEENGHITEEDAEKAKATPLETIERSSDQYVNYPYFAEEVRRKLLSLYGEKGLYEGGLIARTTMNPEYQRIAEKALRDGLVAYDERHGLRSKALAQFESLENWQDQLSTVERPAGLGDWDIAVVLESGVKEATIGLPNGNKGVIPFDRMRWTGKAQVKDLLKVGDVWIVAKSEEKDDPKNAYWLRQIPEIQGGLIAMDPHTGRIYAVAGGFSYAISQFDRAVQAIRQPGSAFKPFVYLAGLQAGFTPATLILDAPFVLDQGDGLDKWRPQNYHEDYNGPTTMRKGLEKSLNLMTIRLANYVGMEKIAEICKNFGVNENLPKLLSMAIGAGDTTLLRMVSAYSVFVNGGKKIQPTFIDRVQDRTGKTIYVHDARQCAECGPLTPYVAGEKTPHVPDAREQIADPRHMYQIVSMMEGVVQRGTGVGIRSLDRPLAGKTGTTNDAKDTWFIAMTPDLIVGVYVGFDEPRSMGKKETGGRVSLPIVREFMRAALKDVPPIPFRVPPGIRMVQINPETGTRSMPMDEKSILEAFVAGTEPGEEAMMFTGQGVSTISDVTNVGEGVNTGLGGLY